MKIDIVTLFPEICRAPLGESIMKRAQENKIVDLHIHNLRDWTSDKHHVVDDAPFGGGQGMVMKPEPIFAAVEELCGETEKTSNAQHPTPNAELQRPKVILMSPTGRRFDQEMARELSRESHLIIICGHYEGVDHRVIEHLVDLEISIGDYVLTNGAIAAVVLVDAVVRLLPDYWKRRNTRARLNFAVGKFPMFCFREITLKSQSGEKNKRKNARARIALICCAKNPGSACVSRALPKFAEHNTRVDSAEAE